MSCTTGCPTQDHESWGACVRSKGLRVGWARSIVGMDLTLQKNHQRRIDEARAARAKGIRPNSTRLEDTRQAVKWSDEHGKPYISNK